MTHLSAGNDRHGRHERRRHRTAAFTVVLSALAMVALGGCAVGDDTSTTTTATITTTTTPAGSGTATPIGNDHVPPLAPVATDIVGVPHIDAAAYAVYDVDSARWLAESEADTPIPVGSVMKLLTAYVVLQSGNLDTMVTVPALTIGPDESVIGLREGEQVRRDVLLRAMLIVSANDAARVLAIDVGGSTENFVDQMNSAALDLGLAQTVAANPVGLDAAGAHSSARDMISLAALLMRNETFRRAVIKPSANLHGQTFDATNDLLGTYDGATGIKTGHTTQAGYCLIGSATRNGRHLIVAVLGAPSDDLRRHSVTALLDWGFSQP